MDSLAEDDPTLPLDFERSTNLAKFKEALSSGASGNALDSSIGLSEDPDMTVGAKPSIFTGSGTLASGVAADGSPQTKTLKDHEFQIAELKKENFGLKLRIYFLEERMNRSLDDTPEDIFKANIELKVEVEKLKKELLEKHGLLVKASNAVETIANQAEAQIQQIKEDHNEELREMREGYNGKVKEIEKELITAKQDVDEMADKLTETTNINQQLNEKLLESTEGFHEDQRQLQEDLKATLDEKDKIIDDLRGDLESKNKEVERHKEQVKTALEKPKQQIQKIQEQYEKTVREFEKKSKQLTEELTTKSKLAEEYKEKGKKAEKLIRELKNKLHDKETIEQLRSRSESGNRTLESCREELDAKESEINKLNTRLKDLEQSLATARESAHTAKMKWYQTFDEHSEAVKAKDARIADLQSNLSAKEIELDRLLHNLSNKDLELQKSNNGKRALEKQLEDMLKQKEQELNELTTKLRTLAQQYSDKVDALEEKCQEISYGAQEQLDIKDRITEKLAAGILEKDKLIEDFVDALRNANHEMSSMEDIAGTKDNLVKKLKDHLRDQKHAIESAVEDKLKAVEDKENELQQLRHALRDRDRLIEKINSAVVEGDEKIKLLDRMCKEKDNSIQTLKKSAEDQQKTNKDALESSSATLLEKEAVIFKLKNRMENQEKELKELKDFVRSTVRSPKQAKIVEDSNKVNELADLLREKEQLIAEMFQERSRMSSAHEANVQRQMAALRDKDVFIKEAAENLARIQLDKNSSIHRLQQLLNSKDHEIQSLENSKAWTNQEHELMINKLKATLLDKDRTIEELVENGREKDKMFLKLQTVNRSPTRSPIAPEMADLRRTLGILQDELQKKDDALRRLEEDIQRNKNNSAIEQELNAENQRRIKEMEQEIATKNALLREAQGAIESLRAKQKNLPKIEELQQKFAEESQALVNAQKAKEEALHDLASLRRSNLDLEEKLQAHHGNADALKHAAQVKDNIIKELQESQHKQLKDMQENINYYQEKSKGNESACDSLKQQIKNLSEQNSASQRQIENYKARLANQSAQDLQELDQLREEVETLRAQLQRPGTPQRERFGGVGAGPDDQDKNLQQLQQLLQAQLQETARLNEILRKEKDVYTGFTQHAKESHNSGTDPVKHDLQVLHAQLEEGIRFNDTLRAQLREQLSSQQARNSTSPLLSARSSPYDAVYQREIQELKAKLEESERWNMSLQARLNELQPRVSGVGGSSPVPVDNVDFGRPDMQGMVSPQTVRKLEQQVDKLQYQLQQSSKLQQQDRGSVGQQTEMDETRKDQDELVKNQAQEINVLKGKLEDTKRTFIELERRLTDANSKLEFYANNMNLDYDEALQEREAEVEDLRRQLDELRNAPSTLGLPGNLGTDMAAQTSPARDWDAVQSQDNRAVEDSLRSDLEESRRLGQQYKKLLDEKVSEIQRLKQKELRSLKESPEKVREMAELQRLRKEYETGIRANEDLRRHFDKEVSSMADERQSAQSNEDELRLVRDQLEETLQRNKELNKQLNESLRAFDDVKRLKLELRNAERINESLGSQVEDLTEALNHLRNNGEAAQLQRQLADANRLVRTLTDQLKETRKSADEVADLQRNLRSTKRMNEDLGKNLNELTNHSAKLKKQIERLEHDLQQRDKTIETLQSRLAARPLVHSRSTSPFTPQSISTPTRLDHTVVAGQGTGLISPPPVGRWTSPTDFSPRKEKQMNSLALQNTLLKSKLKESERLNATLKNELDVLSRLQSTTSGARTSPRTKTENEDLLASCMAEMRELRMRLEESIRTNDGLRAQLEKQLADNGVSVNSNDLPDKLIIVQENNTLKSDLLEKDRKIERLRKIVENLQREKTRDLEQLKLLQQHTEESDEALRSLRQELSVYERLYRLLAEGRNVDVQTDGTSYVREGPKSLDGSAENNALALLLSEIRSLRVQLERSIQTNNALRLKLEEQLRRPGTQSPAKSPRLTVVRQLDFTDGGKNDADSDEKYQATRPVWTAVKDYNELVGKLGCASEEASHVSQVLNSLVGNQSRDMNQLCPVQSSVEKVCCWLKESEDIAFKFRVSPEPIRTENEAGQLDSENKSLREEISRLRHKLHLQDQEMRRACERLEATNLLKAKMELQILEQLSHTQSVLTRARGNLEERIDGQQERY